MFSPINANGHPKSMVAVFASAVHAYYNHRRKSHQRWCFSLTQQDPSSFVDVPTQLIFYVFFSLKLWSQSKRLPDAIKL